MKKGYCAVCDQTVEFDAGGPKGGQRICPTCQSRSRNRSVADWISRNITGFKNVLEIGQFCPLTPLYQRKHWAYTILDIKRPLGEWYVSYRGNICDLPYRDKTFDLVCALSVLEHILNDLRAYNELLRILKPKGTLIVQVPMLSKTGKTEEYGKINPEEFNHCRAPGPDYIDKLRRDDIEIVEIDKNEQRSLTPIEHFYVVTYTPIDVVERERSGNPNKRKRDVK